MKKEKTIIAFILCLSLLAALSVTAFATTTKYAIGTVNFRNSPSTTNGAIIGTFKNGEAFDVQSNVTGDDGKLWYYGYPGSGTDLYNAFGHRSGYSRSVDGNGYANFS